MLERTKKRKERQSGPVWCIRAEGGDVRRLATEFLSKSHVCRKGTLALTLDERQEEGGERLRAHGCLSRWFPWWPAPDFVTQVEIRAGGDRAVLASLDASYSVKMGRMAEMIGPVVGVVAVLGMMGVAAGVLVTGPGRPALRLLEARGIPALCLVVAWVVVGMVAMAVTQARLLRIHDAGEQLRGAFRRQLRKEFGDKVALRTQDGRNEDAELEPGPLDTLPEGLELAAMVAAGWLMWGFLLGFVVGWQWGFWAGGAFSGALVFVLWRRKRKAAKREVPPYRYEWMCGELDRASSNAVRLLVWGVVPLIFGVAWWTGLIDWCSNAGGPSAAILPALSGLFGILMPCIYVLLWAASWWLRTRRLLTVYANLKLDPNLGSDEEPLPKQALRSLRFQAMAHCGMLALLTYIELVGLIVLATQPELRAGFADFLTLAPRAVFGATWGPAAGVAGLGVMLLPLAVTTVVWLRRSARPGWRLREGSSAGRLEARTRAGLHGDLKAALQAKHLSIQILVRRQSERGGLRVATLVRLGGWGRRFHITMDAAVWQRLTDREREALLWHEVFHEAAGRARRLSEGALGALWIWRIYYENSTQDPYEEETDADWYAVEQMGGNPESMLGALEWLGKQHRLVEEAETRESSLGEALRQGLVTVFWSHTGEPLMKPSHPSYKLRQAAILERMGKTGASREGSRQGR